MSLYKIDIEAQEKLRICLCDNGYPPSVPCLVMATENIFKVQQIDEMYIYRQYNAEYWKWCML